MARKLNGTGQKGKAVMRAIVVGATQALFSIQTYVWHEGSLKIVVLIHAFILKWEQTTTY
jgi:hypothetical protein